MSRIAFHTFKFTMLVCLMLAGGCEQKECSFDSFGLGNTGTSPDVVWETNSTHAGLFYPDNEVAQRKLVDITSLLDVDGFVAHFESLGYKIAPEQSFVIEATSDDNAVAITFIVMTPAEPQATGVVAIACCEYGQDFWISPAVFTMSPQKSNAGFSPIAEGLWAKTFHASDFKKSAARISLSKLRDYYNCIYSKLPGQVARCAVARVIASVSYVECLTICTGAQMVGQAIDCLVQASISGGKDKEQQ